MICILKCTIWNPFNLDNIFQIVGDHSLGGHEINLMNHENIKKWNKLDYTRIKYNRRWTACGKDKYLLCKKLFCLSSLYLSGLMCGSWPKYFKMLPFMIGNHKNPCSGGDILADLFQRSRSF